METCDVELLVEQYGSAGLTSTKTLIPFWYGTEVTKKLSVTASALQCRTSCFLALCTMNGMRNKLSGKGAPYPNENTRFTFYLDENMNDTLNVVYFFIFQNLLFWYFLIVSGGIFYIFHNRIFQHRL